MAVEIKMLKEVKYNCVIKITAKDKEYIGRIINLETTDDKNKFNLSEELKYSYRRQRVRNALPATNQYYNLITYVIENNIPILEVSIIFSLQEENKTDGYLLLKKEYEALKESISKGVCLNSNQFPLIPTKYKTSKVKNKWLSHNQWLNIKKLAKRQTEQV